MQEACRWRLSESAPSGPKIHDVTDLTSKTVTGLVATSRLTSTSHRPISSGAPEAFSFPFPLATPLFFSSAETGVELGPATIPNVTTNDFRTCPLAGAFDIFSTA